MKTGNTTPHSASLYDSQIQNTVPYYNLFHDETLKLIAAVQEKPQFWLDTGCGTGTLVQKAAGSFKNTIFIMTDPSAEMVKVAQEKLLISDRFRFLAPTMTQNLQLNFKVDVVTAIQAHHYLTKDLRKKATQTCSEVLRENGIYVTFENIRPTSEKGIQIGQALWSNFQLSRGKEPGAVKKHLERFDTEYFPLTVAEHLTLLRECGFQTAELFWYSTMQAGFYALK